MMREGKGRASVSKTTRGKSKVDTRFGEENRWDLRQSLGEHHDIMKEEPEVTQKDREIRLKPFVRRTHDVETGSETIGKNGAVKGVDVIVV